MQSLCQRNGAFINASAGIIQFLGLVSILAGQLNVRPTKPLLRKDVAPQEDDPDAANSLTADVADQPQSRDTAAPEEDVTDAA
mmetsp:Transcript_16294/g.38824  ORF Transcript_16294/g.38824 Transcript_16294/m.38824 type:complete len:83 (-) Transcript_16294:103-351(-)